MPKANNISVIKATYVHDFKIRIKFNDGKINVVDFREFLFSNNIEMFKKYKLVSNFRRFKIEDGNIVWGKDWDLIFQVYDLYVGKIKYSSTLIQS